MTVFDLIKYPISCPVKLEEVLELPETIQHLYFWDIYKSSQVVGRLYSEEELYNRLRKYLLEYDDGNRI